MKQVIMETEIGKIIAEVHQHIDGYFNDMFIYLERKDGVTIDLVAIDVEDSIDAKVKALVFGNVFSDEYTDMFTWSKTDIESIEE